MSRTVFSVRNGPVAAAAAVVGVVVVALVLSAAPSTAATACDAPDRTWDRGGLTDAWNTAANWSPDGVPLATDHVCIPAAAPGSEVVLSGAAPRSRSSTTSI